MLVQIFIPSHASRLLGNRNAVLAGIACSCFALAVMAFAQSGWMIFAIMPIFALGSMGTPSLQALASQKVSAEHQGQFQGVIASTVSMASMIAPMFSPLFIFSFRKNGREQFG